MEVLRPVGGEGSANPGRSSVCVHYRGPEGHRGGIMTAAVRAPVPSSAAPHVGTAGAREALGPAAPSCPVTSGLWRESCLPTFPPPQALLLPQPPSQQSERPKASLNLWPPLGPQGTPACLEGPQLPGVGARVPSAAVPAHSGRCQGPPWPAQQPVAEGHRRQKGLDRPLNS